MQQGKKPQKTCNSNNHIKEFPKAALNFQVSYLSEFSFDAQVCI